MPSATTAHLFHFDDLCRCPGAVVQKYSEVLCGLGCFAFHYWAVCYLGLACRTIFTFGPLVQDMQSSYDALQAWGEGFTVRRTSPLRRGPYWQVSGSGVIRWGSRKGWPLPSPSGGGQDAVSVCAPGTLLRPFTGLALQ